LPGPAGGLGHMQVKLRLLARHTLLLRCLVSGAVPILDEVLGRLHAGSAQGW